MDLENAPKAKKDRSSLILQLLALIFGFLSTSFLLGTGLLAAVLASAVSCADFLSKRARTSFLGSVVGGGAGLLFTSFFRESVSAIVFTKENFGKDFTLVFDLRLHAAVLLILIPLLSFVFCSCVAKRASRSVCVAASTGVIAAAALAQLVIFTVGKYSDFSIPLLRDKLNVLIGVFEAAFAKDAETISAYYPGYGAEQFRASAVSIVYSLPSVIALFCGALAFLHSFCVKRALRRSGALGFIYTDGWVFVPGIVTAAVYVILYVVMSLLSLFSENSNAGIFGLNVIVTLLSGAFFITGITAVRWFAGARKKAGFRIGAFWIVILAVGVVVFPAVVISLVRLAGLAMVFMREASRRRKNEPPDQQGPE